MNRNDLKPLKPEPPHKPRVQAHGGELFQILQWVFVAIAAITAITSQGNEMQIYSAIGVLFVALWCAAVFQIIRAITGSRS